MKKKTVWRALLALAALSMLRMTLKMAQEVRRYERILAMSDEGTLSQEVPEVLITMLRQQRQTIKEWKNFMRSAPKDAMRYLKIETM